MAGAGRQFNPALVELFVEDLDQAAPETVADPVEGTAGLPLIAGAA